MSLIFHKTQKIVAADSTRFRVLNCGRRWGKTTLAVWEMFAKAVAKDDRHIVYIAPTYQQARDIAWQELKKVCRQLTVDTNESQLKITIKTKQGGISSLWLRGWESVETLRGQRFDFVVVDEIAMMKNWSINWEEVIRPTLTDTKGEGLFISTPKGFNHFYDLYNKERKNSEYKSFHFTSYDNPHLPLAELETARDEITEDRFAQEYMADFRKTEGLVYKEFAREVHIFKDLPQRNFTEKFVGIDWGYTNPTAVLEIKRDGDDNYWVTSEWYRTGLTTKEVIEYISTVGAHAFYPDPAEPDRIEEMRRARLNVREVNKEVIGGIDSVRNLLKNKKLFIHESCEKLINEFETYSYREKKADQNEQEEPVKENDHGLDALRYVLFMQKPIQMRKAIKQFVPNYSSTYGARTTTRTATFPHP